MIVFLLVINYFEHSLQYYDDIETCIQSISFINITDLDLYYDLLNSNPSLVNLSDDYLVMIAHIIYISVFYTYIL